MKNTNALTATDANTSADVLGGTDGVTAAAAPAKRGAKTPGKAARNRNGSAPKRKYTKRGTTFWARRVILLGNEPVGRGRPAKDGKGERKVVYVPVGMEYDVAIHGEGVKYNAHSHRATHKRLAKDSVDYTFDNGVAPKGEKAKATKGGTKATKAQKSAPVNVPVTDVPAAVEPVAPVTVPVEAPAAEHSVDTVANNA